jgi:hypothetical protein
MQGKDSFEERLRSIADLSAINLLFSVDYQDAEANPAMETNLSVIKRDTVGPSPSHRSWKSLASKPSLEPLYFKTVVYSFASIGSFASRYFIPSESVHAVPLKCSSVWDRGCSSAGVSSLEGGGLSGSSFCSSFYPLSRLPFYDAFSLTSSLFGFVS